MPNVPQSIHKMRESANTILHWTFGEGVGTTTQDASGLGGTGTFGGTATWATTGRLKQTAKFLGVAGDNVSTPSTAGLNPNNVTVAVWVVLDAAGAYPMICTKMDSTNLTGYEMRGTAGNRTIQFLAGTGAAYGYIQSSTALTLGVWYFVVATYDGTTLRLYINGVSENAAGLATSGNIATNTLPFQAGDRSGVFEGNPLTGRIDDLLIENVAWSAARVKQEYELLPYATCYA